ncbi:hypothetical protein I4U23_011013 [Adineta vaga]|nr:hypothetical protein I4U23_011013 [Adineta vaga]
MTFIKKAHDIENGLIATRGPTNHSMVGRLNHFHNILDYKNKMQYLYFPDGNYCLMGDLHYPQDNCILEHENYTNSSLYNHNGKEILADTWTYDAFGMISYRKVSRVSCILFESGFIIENIGASTTSVTTGYVEDIVDRSIFAISKECHS